MKAVNGEKPIGALTRFLSDWIRDRPAGSSPFFSFETLRDERVEQKDVERWVLNSNYAYYRFGDYLFERDAIPDNPKRLDELLMLLNNSFKSIKDTTPLSLRSKQQDAIEGELAKDWPPFCAKSRTKLARVRSACEAYAQFAEDDGASLAESFLHEVEDEACWYSRLVEESENTPQPLIERCKALLPLWCLKEVNPLYSLTIWEDEQAVCELAICIADAMSQSGGFPFGPGARAAYLGAVHASQRTYLEGLRQGGTDIQGLPMTGLADILRNGFFSLEDPAPVKGVPPWLFGKAQLIWNIVMVSIFGPGVVLRSSGPQRTSTSLAYGVRSERNDDELRGEVLLRRRYRSGACETVGALTLDGSSRCGLWRVIGGVYDENAALPHSVYRNEYDRLGDRFIESRAYDALGNMVEGMGDSRFHAELSLEVGGPGDTVKLVLRDLNSKNGTYVMRREAGAAVYYILSTRGDAGLWGRRLGVSPNHLEMVESLPLRRGDIIQLCGSCFELL